ncbi:integrase, catalytic region, zinc finger, CCHC-type containing protein [Tanacetum coccineum]
MTNNINHLKEIVDQAWVKHSNDRLHLRNPTAQDMEILVKTCLMPLALKTQNDSFAFVHELKQEMHADLKYVESLEDEVDELGSDKAEFSNMYDMLLQKFREYDCLAQKLSEQTEFIEQLILFIIDSGCTKHMTSNLSLLCNFVEKYLGTVRFGNDQICLSSGYGDLVQGNIMINRVYYVKGLNHNLFSIGQFCDADLEVAFQKSTCFVRDLEANDLLTGNRGTVLLQFLFKKHFINSYMSPGLKHHHSSHGLASKTFSSQLRLHQLAFKERCCDWFTKTEDEIPKVLKDFLTMIQRNLQAPVISVRTDRGTEFLNKTLNAFFKEEGIEHQTSTPRTPERTALSKDKTALLLRLLERCFWTSKLPLSLLGLKQFHACYTLSIHINHYIQLMEKTDGENLDKMKVKRWILAFLVRILQLSQRDIVSNTFKVLETQFQMFIKSRMYLDDEFVVMTRNYFLQYTQLAIPEFRDTLIQHMESVKKSIDERAKHKQEYNSWVNERQMQTTEDKVDSSKALDASLVDTESSGKTLKEQDTSSRSGNDAHVDDADIRPIYDEEPMAEVQTTAEINIFATGQQHTEQPEFNNEGKVDQNAEQCHDTCPLPAKLTDNQTTELSNQSLESENIRLKKTVAQFQKDFLRMEAHCVNLELKYQNQALKEGQHGQFLKVTSNEAKVPTRKIFTSSTTKVDSKPTNGSNEDITNQYECEQTLDVSACTLNLSAGTSFNPKKEGLRVCSELGIHDHSNEPSSSKLVPKVVPLADKTTTSRQELELLFHHHITMLRSYALSWKPSQGFFELPDHKIHKDGDGGCLYSAEVGFNTTFSCSKLQRLLSSSRFKNHESSRIKDKDFRTNSDIQDLPSKISSLSR